MKPTTKLAPVPESLLVNIGKPDPGLDGGGITDEELAEATRLHEGALRAAGNPRDVREVHLSAGENQPFLLEYQRDEAAYAAEGVSLEAYVLTRRVDEGLDVLGFGGE